ncbi:hypothetical protein pipiens_017170 [Culex pipiens pipiens]|uniref:Uncharacterized protein n=1 Tax=Culex pipiens pipiens TaxID=38569 RepID=A0ABD1CHS9_CULPP
MNRSLNRFQSSQDLTMGVIGAIVSLAVTLLQHLNGHGSNNPQALLAAMEPIQRQLAKLRRQLKVVRQRQLAPAAVPLNATYRGAAPLNTTLPRVLDATYAAPLNTTRPTVASPGRVGLPRLDTTYATAAATMRNAPGINATFPAPPANRTLPTPDDYQCPPGFREISNLESWLDESSTREASTRDPTQVSLERSYDANYYPDMNRIVAELESSGAFRPPLSSTQPEMDVTFDRGAAIAGGPAPNPSPISYQVRESNNTRNLDGSLSHVSRTVSGPDMTNVSALNTSLPPFDSSN